MKIIKLYILLPITILLFTYQPYSGQEIPKTEKENISTEYFGKKVPDPYRWLEDANSEKVKKWIDEQNVYTEKLLSSFPEGKPLAKRIEELSITSVRQYSPILIKDKLFFIQYTPPQAQPVVAYKTWPNGKVKVLFDPNKEKSGTAMTEFWPSPDGNYLAYGTAVGGSEATTIHILDVKNNVQLKDTLPHAGGGTTLAGVLWDENMKGLTYVRLPLPGTVPDSELQFNAALYHHLLGQSFNEDKLVFGKNLSPIAEYSFLPSEGAKSAAMFVHFGDGSAAHVYLRSGNNDWKQVLDTPAKIYTSSDGNSGAVWKGQNLFVVSYEDAPRGKLITVNSDGSIKTIIPQGDWAMNSVFAVKGGFLITRVLGPDWKVDHFNDNGKLVRTVELPKTGIGIYTIASSDKSDQALIDYSGWTIPERWTQYNSTNGRLKTTFEVKPAADYSKIKITRVDAVSKDGTKIPVTIVAADNITPNGKNPSFVYGYGGFGINTAPRFLGSNLAWIEKGGVIAYANIRGGGEFGEGWHEAGMLDKKQNCFDDMYAAAQSLIKNKWTDTQHLGILGGSNGGLLMGAEITQHPEAFKAVVSFVGVYDMIRVQLFPNGMYNTSEFGNSNKAKDFNWLLAYSPYHNVKPNTAYPAVLMVTGNNDPRVAPWQSRKFTAALQAANTSGNPILLLSRMNEGHGVTESFSQRVGNTAAQLTFFAHELGLNITNNTQNQ